MRSILALLLVSIPLNAFIDLQETSQDAADSVAILSATGELIKEVDEESKKISETEKEIRELREQIGKTETFGRRSKDILKGPGSSVEDTASKISSLRAYIRNLKSYYSKYVNGVISADAVKAVDGIKGNSDEVRRQKLEINASLNKTKKELEDEKRRQEILKKDRESRKAISDDIDRILGVGDVSSGQ